MGQAATGPAREPRGLSHARTSFVGRSDAVDKVAWLLTRYRLVTVTGPGGVGKTRLADEVLRQVAGRFADGVWVAELASVAEPALVPAMVATVLGLHQAAGAPIVDALATRLARQQLLLVLDNCEHVLDAVAQFCATVLLSPTISGSWPPAGSLWACPRRPGTGCLRWRCPGPETRMVWAGRRR